MANSIYYKKGLSYSIRVKNLSDHEKLKSYPERYPTNNDAVGIEIVGLYNKINKTYEDINTKQNASLKWLVNQLSRYLDLQNDDIYRHPDVSRKEPSEAKAAKW